MLIQKNNSYTYPAPKQTQRVQAQPKGGIKFGMDVVVALPSRATSEYVSQTVKHSAGKLLTEENQKILVKYVTQAVASAVQEGTLNEKNHQNVRAFVNRTIQEALTDNEAAVSKSLTNIIERTIANLFENNKKRMNRIFQQNFYPLRQMGVGSGMAAAGYYVLPSIASPTLSNTVLGTGLATAALGAYNLKSTLEKPLDTSKQPMQEAILAAFQNDPMTILNLVRRHKIDIDGIVAVNEHIRNITPLGAAALMGSDKAIKQLIDLGANIDQTDHGNRTALWWAAAAGKTQSVKSLIDAGANLDIANDEHQTPLWTAANLKHLDVVKMLLHAGANMDIADKGNVTPLLQAIATDHVGIALELINNGANLNIAANPPDAITPLTRAALSSNRFLIKTLLRKGADPNIPINIDNHKMPLLVYALGSGYTDIALMLLANGADPNVGVRTEHGNYVTPLMIAKDKGNTQLIHAIEQALKNKQ